MFRLSSFFLWCIISITLFVSRKSLRLASRYDVHPVKIGGDRQILPGDYVVNDKYGVGQFVGFKDIPINPKDNTKFITKGVVIQFADTEVTWFEKLIGNQLYLYRSYEDGEQELDTALNTKRWERRKLKVKDQSAEMAKALTSTLAVRNHMHRLPCIPDNNAYNAFEKQFRFEPSSDQLQCFTDIADDMINNTRPMDRLICGDVGFGKTEVAMRAIYRAVLSGKQVAVLAPTRVLATQHFQTMTNRMPNVVIRLLKGGQQIGKKDAMAKVRKELATGVCQVTVGTHALLYGDWGFQNLGLVVIDEEQRFGVAHKEKLKQIATGVDVLTLSATPIPRTMQMSLANLKDFTLLQSPPKGRKEVKVTMLKEDDGVMVGAIEREMLRNGQTFIVVPFIKDQEDLESKLKDLIPDVKVLTVNGRQKPDLFDSRIQSFVNREADVLLATTVVENGIDMPNVNTIIVMKCENFGMASLYQLRGRVGRSDRQAYAFFMIHSKQQFLKEKTSKRLSSIEELTALGSGFDLARRDLEIRGFGKIFGTEQSGSFDIGLDLTTIYLKQALEEMQERILIPISDCKLTLQDKIESIYEHDQTVATTSKALSNSLQEMERMRLYLSRLLLPVKNSNNNSNMIDSYVQQLLSQREPSRLEDMQQQWLSQSTHFQGQEKELKELFLRRKLYLTARKVSISEIITQSSTTAAADTTGVATISTWILKFQTLVTKQKWNRLLSIFITAEEDIRKVSTRLRFVEKDPIHNSMIEYSPSSSFEPSSRSAQDVHAYHQYCMNELAELLTILAKAVDEMIKQEVSQDINK